MSGCGIFGCHIGETHAHGVASTVTVVPSVTIDLQADVASLRSRAELAESEAKRWHNALAAETLARSEDINRLTLRAEAAEMLHRAAAQSLMRTDHFKDLLAVTERAEGLETQLHIETERAERVLMANAKLNLDLATAADRLRRAEEALRELTIVARRIRDAYPAEHRGTYYADLCAALSRPEGGE